ncbi:thioredoxin family protein [Portibacter lacus]|uniref:Thioredoxin domain-containing protein n=1 Tax=Portibacter lacus TaxID=1099794 RepID=A0AA37SWY9_9BACT|nr:thioredoxin family protein [Portibacter lacus]GLR19175.1 hypothetical protein GCM10007940_37910 [Portibacter lacus]
MKNVFLKSSALLLLFFFTLALTGPADGYKVGDKATNFSLKNIDGEMVSLSDYPDAKGYIVIFTCNECPYAKMYEDRINELNNKYASQGYPVIAIMPNDPNMQPGDSFENMQKRAKEKGFTFPYLIDEGQEIFPQYGAQKTPHVYLLDSDHIVKYIGAIDNNPKDPSAASEKYVENAIEALEAGSNPDPSMTKAVGCGIKKKRA